MSEDDLDMDLAFDLASITAPLGKHIIRPTNCRQRAYSQVRPPNPQGDRLRTFLSLSGDGRPAKDSQTQTLQQWFIYFVPQSDVFGGFLQHRPATHMHLCMPYDQFEAVRDVIQSDRAVLELHVGNDGGTQTIVRDTLKSLPLS